MRYRLRELTLLGRSVLHVEQSHGSGIPYTPWRHPSHVDLAPYQRRQPDERRRDERKYDGQGDLGRHKKCVDAWTSDRYGDDDRRYQTYEAGDYAAKERLEGSCPCMSMKSVIAPVQTRRRTETLHSMNPSETICPARVAVMLAVWPAQSSARAKMNAAAVGLSDSIS